MTNELLARIGKKAAERLNADVETIEQIPGVSDNTVFAITAGGKPYIFKIYTLRDWPEDGKLLFINRKLIEHGIPCAKIIAFDRCDPDFPSGYLIEERLPGVTADRALGDADATRTFYAKLARLVSQLHRIRIENHGYIGAGVASHGTFLAFMDDKLDEIAEPLVSMKRFEAPVLAKIKERVLRALRPCADLPAVLNHGDLSVKNVLIDERGEVTLVDYDDALALNWIADIARLTYWMRYSYDAESYAAYRDVFLRHYADGGARDAFESLENAFHAWIGLDHLLYYAGRPQSEPKYARALAYFNACVAGLG
jgi:Ser/Thr protein kinase RdoA (MazF antagonist)